MTCEADEKSVFSHQFQMNLQYIAKSGEPCLGLPDARYTVRNAAVLLNPWISVGGHYQLQSFSKAGAEADRVNDDSNCAALLAAAVNDSTDVGCPEKRVEPW